MMAQKHLHELLREEQEPFLLNNYISDRRSQMKRPSTNTSLQLKKRKPLHHTHNSHFPLNLCKNACLFSFQAAATPDNLTKSPLFEFASPAKSPRKSPNAIFLHIPSRTAALRIHKQSKTRSQPKGFALFGSFFRKLKTRKKEIEAGGASAGADVSVKDILSRAQQKRDDNGNAGFGCSYNGRSSSAVWSESNEEEDKSLETSTSSCSCSHSQEIIDFVTDQIKHGADCPSCHHAHAAFCDSPFRFVLQRTPSSGRNTPELASPATSPTRHTTQDKEGNCGESLTKFQSGEEEEDKEQCSPVSVLEPSFDDEGHENEDEDEEEEEEGEEGGFDLECSYAIVQRARQQLLYKLRRFEKLAGLDPVELEKTMLDQDETSFTDEDDFEDEGSESSTCEENGFRELVSEALRRSSVHQDRVQIPEGLKKLVSDLIAEEVRGLCSSEEGRETVVRRVCKRLELWKEVEANTIDMMIEDDFSREESGWKKNGEQVRDMAGELELAIFGFLVEEFSEELEYC